MKISTYLYNNSNKLALVALDDKRPFRAYWPLRFIQIVGAKRWSLSLCIFSTEKPLLVKGLEDTFILDPKNDKAARFAMRAYAIATKRDGNSEVYDDIIARLDSLPPV